MFPLRHTVTHIPCVGTGEDDMGNDARLFGQPVQRKVYGWTTRRVETLDGHTSRTVSRVDLSMPATPVSVLDQFVVAGDLFEATEVRDYNTGFHGWKPGIVVELKRVTG